MTSFSPLRGIRVVELAGGVGGAWAGRLLADLGASVLRLEPATGDPLAQRREAPDAPESEGLLTAWLNGGKDIESIESFEKDGNLAALVSDCDFLIRGEEADGRALEGAPRKGTIDISWFGRSGPRADWRGSDLAAQALCGVIHPAGPVEGPPQQLGDIHSALVGGVAAATAPLASLLSEGPHRHFEVSILEACMVLGELYYSDACQHERAVPRVGVNRYLPTCPVGIHKCREGWLGITVITPAQWLTFCELLDMQEQAADPGLATIHLRSERAEELEAIIDQKLKTRSAEEWAALGREKRVPLVVVPDAEAILDHPVFSARGTLAPVLVDGVRLSAPGSPIDAGIANGAASASSGNSARNFGGEGLLSGMRVVDFSMGWAGPLATRILADFGAEVVKIEAGRYPDWWRGTDWSPEAIARHQFEESRRFSAVNRGKKSASLDLTTKEGAAIAKRLVAASDVVIENHAAGVMDKLGLGWKDLSAVAPNLVMASMSAFGTGNVWSETRAYGSTLEQASGTPSFRGAPEMPPMMGHIAYGDPIGGIYGAAAMLAALVDQKRNGASGRWINMSHVECLLPFAAPAVLARGATGVEPERIRNRHVAMTPHGIYRCEGDDRWIAIAIDSDEAWRAFARALERPDWIAPEFASASLRRAREDEIDAAIGALTGKRSADDLAAGLQAVGVIAAPIERPEETYDDPHLHARGAFYDSDRRYLGHQRQIAATVLIDGMRPGFSGVAPFLGADTRQVLSDWLKLGDAEFETLIEAGVTSLRPTSLRGA